jgi:signal transduction histidine kinase
LADYLVKIEGRIRKLDEFVKSMLNYARVSRSEVNATQVYPEEIVNNCLRELEYLENFKQIQVTINCSDKGPILTDATTLRLIIANIVSNAFKYYNPRVESHLNITITRNNKNVMFVFADNGIGIHKEYLDKIFDMFFRATEKSEGSGLGMYIVKQAVDKLKGTIDLKSEYGKGTTITLVIPH